MLADEGAGTGLGCDLCEDLANPSGAAFRHGGDGRIFKQAYCGVLRRSLVVVVVRRPSDFHRLHCRLENIFLIPHGSWFPVKRESWRKMDYCQKALRKRMTLRRNPSNDNRTAEICCTKSQLAGNEFQVSVSWFELLILFIPFLIIGAKH